MRFLIPNIILSWPGTFLCKYFKILTDSPCLYDCKILFKNGFIRNFVKCLWLIWREQTHQISLPEWMSGVFLFKVHVSRIYEEKRRVQRENKWLNLLRSWCISERCIWCHENRFHSLSKKLFGCGASTIVLGRGTKTWLAGKHCYLESCFASGKFLRMLYVEKPAKLSGHFHNSLDGIRSVWVVWNFPDIFQIISILLNGSKTVRILPYDLLLSILFLKQISG